MRLSSSVIGRLRRETTTRRFQASVGICWCAVHACPAVQHQRNSLLGRVCCRLGWLRCCLVAPHDGVAGAAVRSAHRSHSVSRSLAYGSTHPIPSLIHMYRVEQEQSKESSTTHGAAGGGAAAAGTGAGGRSRGGRGATAPVARGELCFGCVWSVRRRVTMHTGPNTPSIPPHHPPTTHRPPRRSGGARCGAIIIIPRTARSAPLSDRTQPMP